MASVPVSMMLPPKASRSTIAAQRAGASVSVFVQPEKESLADSYRLAHTKAKQAAS